MLRLRMAKVKTLDERLWGAAVVKMSFVLRDALDSPAAKSILPGVMRDLDVSESDVDAYIERNRAKVEKAARGAGVANDS